MFFALKRHWLSRVVDRQIVLHEAEKEQVDCISASRCRQPCGLSMTICLAPCHRRSAVHYMRMYEMLFGLHIITYCVMGNHFHVLVEVPKRPEVLPTDEELVALVRKTNGNQEANSLASWFQLWREQGNHAAAEQERENYFRQMWDVSQFMKVLKQRFTQWFNGSRPVRRKGTLWEDRFRSVLVQSGEALRAMAAYIDLNPIRAKLVADPMEYRWSGYGEACAGRRLAKKGLHRVLDGLGDEGLGDVAKKEGILAWYRVQLVGRGQEKRNVAGKVTKAGFSEADLEKARAGRGKIPRHEYLRLRVRYFTDGAVLGSRAFVNGIFEAKREWFSEKRKDGARTLKGLGRTSPLRTMRALVRAPVSGADR